MYVLYDTLLRQIYEIINSVITNTWNRQNMIADFIKLLMLQTLYYIGYASHELLYWYHHIYPIYIIELLPSARDDIPREKSNG